MTTQALAEVRQTVLGWLRSEPAATVSVTNAHTPVKTASADSAPRKAVSDGTLNMLLLAMFSSASRMDSFGNFR